MILRYITRCTCRAINCSIRHWQHLHGQRQPQMSMFTIPPGCSNAQKVECLVSRPLPPAFTSQQSSAMVNPYHVPQLKYSWFVGARQGAEPEKDTAGFPRLAWKKLDTFSSSCLCRGRRSILTLLIGWIHVNALAPFWGEGFFFAAPIEQIQDSHVLFTRSTQDARLRCTEDLVRLQFDVESRGCHRPSWWGLFLNTPRPEAGGTSWYSSFQTRATHRAGNEPPL